MNVHVHKDMYMYEHNDVHVHNNECTCNVYMYEHNDVHGMNVHVRICICMNIMMYMG